MAITGAIAFACGHGDPPPKESRAELTSALVAAPDPASQSWNEAIVLGPLPPPEGHRAIRGEPLPPPGEETPAAWAQRRPAAARELVRWGKEHPAAKSALVTWERDEPEKARALIEWAAGHPNESLDSFLMTRLGWDSLRSVRVAHPDAVDALLVWCHRSPRAAEELVTRSHGLATVVELSDRSAP